MEESGRRTFLKYVLSLPVIFIYACRNTNKSETYVPEQCDDYHGLEQNDLDLRKGFGYVQQSPIAESHCSNCNLYNPPREGESCGGCALFKGPVFADGYCTYWAPQV